MAARGRRRIFAARRDGDGARRARSDFMRRRHQLAAAPDALGHRRSGRIARPRYRRESRAAGRRQEFAGPHFGEHCLWAQGAGHLAPRDAVRPHRAGAGQRLLARRRHCHRIADRPDGVPEKPARRGAARRRADLQRRADDGGAIFLAVPRALCRQLCLPRRGAAAGKPRQGRADFRRSAPAGAHPPEFPRHRQRPQDPARRAAHGARHLPPSADARRS